jgi:hypothetical protein
MSVFIEVHNSDGSEEYLPLVATCILVERVEGEKDGYCLVRNAEDGEWYMGVRVGEDAIVCWASYGASLEDAIDAL